MNTPRIYLDHSATTPLHPLVAQAMADSLFLYGNPSSLHTEGRLARQAVEGARHKVSQLLGASPADVFFTSGGTESNNTALLALAEAAVRRGRPLHVVSTPLEHPSVQKPLARLRERGFRVTLLPVDAHGRLDPDSLRRLLNEDPVALVSLSLVNHELGNLYPVAQLAQLSRQHGALVHCDAVQAAGKFPVDARALGVDTLSVSAHKLYGPKGIGALYVAGPAVGSCGLSLELSSLVVGGEQERGRRAGTENVLGIIGFGVAADLAGTELLPGAAELCARRNRLEAGLLALPDTEVNGDSNDRSPTVCNVRFAEVDGELLLASLDLDGIAVSTGAACSSGSSEASPVLRALGQSKTQAREAIRFSLGRTTSDADIDRTLACVAQSVTRIRALGPGPKL
jgi:cysteine desulfurase